MYSVEEVAGILGLGARTVRGYVRDGRLKAVRIGKQYRITEDDLQEFTGGALDGPRPVVVTPDVTVTAIVEIAGAGRHVMDRITTHTVAAAMAASKDAPGVHVHTIYDDTRDSLRVVVSGSADDTAAMITLIDTLTQEIS